MNNITIVCRALITDNQNRVLFVKKTGSNFWSLPGGKLDADDENLQSCLIRELREELGIEAIINKDIRFVQELHKNNTRYIELIWEATLAVDLVLNQENIQKTSGNELTDIRWIKKEDLRNTNVKPEFLKDLANV
jgi:8-oxo-dGTP pyrophosphatase MutT (NUDIX family)